MLEEELRELSQKLVQLRRESGIPDWFFEQKELLDDKAQENVRLRDAMHQHDMYLANANRIMLAEYMVRIFFFLLQFTIEYTKTTTDALNFC